VEDVGVGVVVVVAVVATVRTPSLVEVAGVMGATAPREAVGAAAAAAAEPTAAAAMAVVRVEASRGAAVVPVAVSAAVVVCTAAVVVAGLVGVTAHRGEDGLQRRNKSQSIRDDPAGRWRPLSILCDATIQL
jgi:hypothetical protein